MKKSITIGKVRTALYKTAKVLGDINAIKRSTITQRASNRALGKFSGRVIPNVTRRILKLFK